MRHARDRSIVWLCMAVFFVQPLHLGIWLAGVAEVKTSLMLSKSELAFALLGMPVGLLPTLYFAGNIVERIGARRALLWSFGPMLAVGILPGLAASQHQLFAALFAFGVVIAFAEVGLNVFAARAEKETQKKFMNRAHGFWSLGVMIGSLIGVQMAGLGFGISHSLIYSAMGLLPVVLLVGYWLPEFTTAPDPHEHPENKAIRTKTPPLPKALILIVCIVFGATLIEGAMIDWASVYMRDVAHIMAGREGLAVTVFSGFVTVGRFVGDSINARFGADVLARICLSCALFGILMLIANLGISVSFLGFALVGLGVSTIFPLGISASAAQSKSGEARNVSIMTFGALSGFLIGPPVIGLLAEATALNLAFFVLLPGILTSFALAHKLKITSAQ